MSKILQQRSRVLVVGSIAYDVVFSVHNIFQNEIIIEQNQAKNVSMMLTAKNKQVYFGGTGGNIAYGLGIQGLKPILCSVVGGDFAKDYQQHLETNNVELRLLKKSDEFTASFYAISDQKKQQIGIFQPNTHGDYMDTLKLKSLLSTRDFQSIKVAIFSPGTGISISNQLEEFRRLAGKDPIVIFDPSQVLSIFFTPELLRKCLKLSNIFIGNETEVNQLQKMLNLSLAEIIATSGLNFIIETLGKDGSIIHSKTANSRVKPISVLKFIEQTGAGDAYRAGFIKGLVEDMSIEACCNLGSVLGAKNVETKGGQTYSLGN